MKFSKSFRKIGSIMMALVIVISSMAVPVSADSDESSHPAYAKATADRNLYINETGLTESELRKHTVYEVLDNMEVVERTWEEMDKRDGEFILRLLDHDPENEAYPHRVKGKHYNGSLYEKARNPVKEIYAFRKDPLHPYQPCPEVHMYTKILGFENINAPGQMGPPAREGNYIGPKGPATKISTTNIHAYTLLDPRFETNSVDLTLEYFLESTYGSDPYRMSDDEHFALDELSRLYKHVMIDGRLVREEVSPESYQSKATKGEGEDPSTLEFNVTIDEKEDVVAYEIFIEIENVKKYAGPAFSKGNDSYSYGLKIDGEVNSKYYTNGTSLKETDYEAEYTVDQEELAEYVKRNNLEEYGGHEGLKCMVEGENPIYIDYIHGPKVDGNPGPVPPENSVKGYKIFIGDVEALDGSLGYDFTNVAPFGIIRNGKPYKLVKEKIYYSNGGFFNHHFNDEDRRATISYGKSNSKHDENVRYASNEFVIFNDITYDRIEEIGVRYTDERGPTDDFEPINDQLLILVKNDNGKLGLLGSKDPYEIPGVVHLHDQGYSENEKWTFEFEPDSKAKKVAFAFDVETKDIEVNKEWVGKVGDKAQVELLVNGDVVDTATLTADNGWKHTFKNIPLYEIDVDSINLDELKKGEVDINYTENEIEVREIEQDGYRVEIKDNGDYSYTIVNRETTPAIPLVPAKTSIEVEKEWELFSKKAVPVTVELHADGKKVDDVVLSEENSWKHTFVDLPVVNEITDESSIEYTVKEITPDGFESTTQRNGNKFTIINKEIIPQKPLVPAKTKISVNKEWDLFEKEEIPVTVELHADGKKIDEVVLSDENDWKHTFTDLPVVNEVTDEKAIEYTVHEIVPEGFEEIIEREGNVFTITNKEIIPQKPLIPAKTKVTVNKEWQLFQKDKMPVTVELHADGKKIDEVVLSNENEWTHTFTDLPVVNDVTDEKAIEYTVHEIVPEGFEEVIEREGNVFTITNKEIVPQFPLVPGKTSVSVVKEWQLFQKDKQPVTVELLADGSKVSEVVLSDENDWKHTFTDLPVVNEITDEDAIVYTVREVTPEGFESVITGDQSQGFHILNKEIIPLFPLTPGKTNVTVNKVWQLFQKDKMPVTVELHANGNKVDEVVLSDENEWTHTFTDLPVVNDIADESAIEYTVHEITPEGFESIIEGNADDGFIITNKEIVPLFPLFPGKTSVTVSKEWDLIALDKVPVTIELYADDVKVDEVVISDENEWVHTFTDLPVVNDITDEKAIEYTVKEVAPEGFEVEIEEIDGVFIIRNKEIPVPEIIAEKKANKEEIQPGEDVTYTIIVENVGTGSKLVNIKDPMENLIDDIEFIGEYVMVNDVPYTFSELMNGIDVEIQPGEVVEVEFAVKFAEDAEGEYINIAYVDEFEPEVPVTVTPPQPEYPDCNEPQDPNNPNPDCPVEPEYPDCNEPQDPNNPNPNCPVIPEEPEVDTPQHVTPPENTTEKPIVPEAKEDSPVDTGDVQHVIPVSLGFLGLAIAYALRKRKDD